MSVLPLLPSLPLYHWNSRQRKTYDECRCEPDERKGWTRERDKRGEGGNPLLAIGETRRVCTTPDKNCPNLSTHPRVWIGSTINLPVFVPATEITATPPSSRTKRALHPRLPFYHNFHARETCSRFSLISLESNTRRSKWDGFFFSFLFSWKFSFEQNRVASTKII